MRINTSVIVLAVVLELASSTASHAQAADARRLGVSVERASRSGHDGLVETRDTTIAVAPPEVNTGTHVAIGAVLGAIVGVVITSFAISDCEKNAQHGERGMCGLGVIVVGPYAVGGGALAGGLLGWLHAASER
jgi:hypothetical protein